MIPNLIIPGAAKSGTSSLHDLLDQHPKIQMSTVKEPHLYSIDKNYNKRFDSNFKTSFDNIFQKDKKIVYYGESSTSYLPSSDIAAKRIFMDSPKTKFIILLRNPITRIESHFNWLKSFNKVNGSIYEEVIKDKDYSYNCNKKLKGGYFKSYIHHSLYYKSISYFLKYFNKNNFLIITTDELRKDHQKAMNKCFSFLHLNPIEINSIEKNKTSYLYNNSSLKQRLYPIYLKIPKFARNLIPNNIKNLKIVSRGKRFSEERFEEKEKENISNFLKEDLNKLSEEFRINFN